MQRHGFKSTGRSSPKCKVVDLNPRRGEKQQIDWLLSTLTIYGRMPPMPLLSCICHLLHVGTTDGFLLHCDLAAVPLPLWCGLYLSCRWGTTAGTPLYQVVVERVGPRSPPSCSFQKVGSNLLSRACCVPRRVQRIAVLQRPSPQRPAIRVQPSSLNN